MNAFIRCMLLVPMFLCASLAQAANIYVQSIKAPILSAPSFGSPRMAEAAKGELLKEIEKKGGWHRVEYKNKTGWVSRLLIGTKPPAARVSVLEGSSENLSTGARRRASAFTTAAAARGLAEDRSRVSDKYRVNFTSLERMEAFKISDRDALAFLQAGVGK